MESGIHELYKRLDRLTEHLDEERAVIALIDLYADASACTGAHDITDFIPMAINENASSNVIEELHRTIEAERDPWLRAEYASWLRMPGVRREETRRTTNEQKQ
ncbi:hypothetical protein [Saccharibacillus endophyticus]|uniref:Uncharacterized protein n=1 Tax=Saccharibacillus endophyticus TaxID=2060666 RepID=A0ABQ1ZSI3_9BACL|nr:hypothetical protein [Saccharibacillus endophyticus]GGH76934.1 hypothetical protein GCM10007362_19930 [Saccharibacillus endophyticus]